jgi:hypothetical protein
MPMSVTTGLVQLKLAIVVYVYNTYVCNVTMVTILYYSYRQSSSVTPHHPSSLLHYVDEFISFIST